MAVRVSSPSFVGRARELEVLLEAAQTADGEGGRLVLVEGEAGVGKSRLITELTARFHDSMSTLVVGRCLALGEEAVPYAPFTDIVRRLCQRLPPPELEAFRQDLGAPLGLIVPELELPRPAGERREFGTSERGALFEAVVALVDRVALTSGGPSLVLVVEDLHWADRSSRDLLAFLLQRSGRRVVVVATCRSEELDSRHPLRTFLAEVHRSGRLSRVELSRFDRSTLFDQLTAILGVPPSTDLANEIWARSEGNPFLAEELLVLARGGPGAALPGTLRDLLLARTRSLDGATQRVLGVAAVGGRRVDEGLVAAVAGIPDNEVLDAVRNAMEAAVLGADEHGGIAFRHALMQEAVYGELLPAERRHHHMAYARVLSEHPTWAGDAGVETELAHHFSAGGDLPRALEWSLAAARAAESRTAFPEASRHFQRAVEIWDRAPDAETTAGVGIVSLLERAADVALLAGDVDWGVVALRDALSRLGPDSDPMRRALLHERLARFLWLTGDADGSVAETEQAVHLLSSRAPSLERARVVAVEGHSLLLAARYRESRERCAEAVELARAADARAVEGYALNTLGLDLVYLGQADLGLEHLHRAKQIAEELNLVDDLQRAYFNLATAAATRGRLQDAVATALDGAAAVAGLGFAEGSGYLYRKAAEYELQLGRWDQAAALCRKVLELVRTPVTLVQTHTIAGTLELRRGRLDTAKGHLEAALAMSADMAGGWFHGWLLCLRAELALAEGDGGSALAAVDEAIQAVAGTDAEILLRRLIWLGSRGHVAKAERATTNRVAEVEAARTAAAELAERSAAWVTRLRERGVALYPEGEALAATVVAELAGVGERPDPEAWSRAADAWARLGQPFELAYARWRQGAALLATRSDRRETEAALREARALAIDLGAAPLRAEVEDLARRARLGITGPADLASPEPLPPESPAEAVGLTKREAEVLSLVAAGRSNRQIGAALFMSEKTASVHVSRILTKLAVSSRGEAAALAHRLGLVENADG